MSNMVSKAQGLGLSLITKLAGSDVLDQLKLRKFVERSLYQGSKTGFKALSKAQKTFKSNSIDRQRLPRQNKDLFDLSLTEEQTMTREAMRKFAQEVLYTHAHQADHDAQFPETIWQYLDELGLNYYALPEAAGGVASEQNIVSNILIAEDLAQGDFSLAAGILSSFSAINAITRWGSQSIQSRYLSAFAEDSQLKATFATQENTAAFNPFQLKTTAKREGDHFYLDGQKTLVLLGEHADLYLVSAMLEGQPDVFVVERSDTIAIKSSPAMGLKATETVTLEFQQTPAQRLGDDDFDYSAFVDLGNLMWCAMAVGTCEAVKRYCIDYAMIGSPLANLSRIVKVWHLWWPIWR